MTKLDDLEKRVARLELKVDRPPVEDIRSWIATYYNSRKECAAALGISVNYVDRLCMGDRQATPRIVQRMIEDGFYGPEMMG